MAKFGKLFSKSWGEYKYNFGTIFKIFFWLLLIPFLAQSLIFLFSFEGIDFTNPSSVLEMFSPLLLIVLFIVIILNIISGMVYIYMSFYQKPQNKITFKQSVKGGLKYFWKYLGLLIVSIFLLAILFILFIIPGIIFMIFWAFATFVLIRENTGIWESLKRSKLIVKGRWWRTFGYVILLGLIMMLISGVFSIPETAYTIFSIASGRLIGLISANPPIAFVVSLITFLARLITVPLTILFMKNFYLDLRTNK